MSEEESPEEMPQRNSSEVRDQDEQEGKARIAGTAIVAVGVVLLMVVAAATVFFLLAGVLRGEWLMAGGALVVMVALLWLIGRLVRVAANQNKKPLG